MNQKRAFVAVGLLVSVIFLWFAFRDLQPGAVWGQIRQADPLPLLIGAGAYFGAVALIAWRWQFVLRSICLVPLTGLIPLVAIGYMGNNVYPFRSGEALRVLLLRRDYGVPVVKVATTAVVERVFDGLVMLTFIVVPLLFIDLASDEIRAVATFAAPIFIAALIVFLALAAQPGALRRLIHWGKRFVPARLHPPVDKLSEGVIGGLEGLRSPAYLAGAVITSYLSWMVEAGVYWIVSMAFDLDASYGLMLVVVGTVNLAGLLPASPGQIGVYEFFVSAVLIAAGVAEPLAASYALTVHGVIWLPVTLVGFYFLARRGLGLSAISRARAIETEAIDLQNKPGAIPSTDQAVSAPQPNAP